MSKKILLKYLIMYSMFILGSVFYVNGVINVFSSLLLFGGGYLSIKSTFDYRIRKRNINMLDDSKKDINFNNKIDDNDKSNTKIVVKPKRVENVIGFKRVRRYTRVRRKY